VNEDLEKSAPAAAYLLEQIATALTVLESWDLHPRLKHNTVYTDVGYVLPTDDEGFVVRTLTYLPFDQD
jgi:hypothetical protein